jgi:hypothetical protein
VNWLGGLLSVLIIMAVKEILHFANTNMHACIHTYYVAARIVTYGFSQVFVYEETYADVTVMVASVRTIKCVTQNISLSFISVVTPLAVDIHKLLKRQTQFIVCRNVNY